MLFKFAMNIYLKKLQNTIFPRNINVPMSWCGPNHIVDFPEAGYHPDILPRPRATSVLVYPL